MAADGEVEDIDRYRQAAVGPQPPRNARPSFRPSFGKHLVDPLRLGIARDRRGNLRRHQQGHAGVVRAYQAAGNGFVSQVEHERPDARCRRREDVQQRAPRRRPAAPGELILLTIKRQVIAAFVRDDFSGHTAVEAVAFDEALGPRRFLDATLRLVFTDKLRDQRHADLEFGPFEFQGLLAIVADRLSLAVRGTVLDFVGHQGRDFVAGNVIRKGLAAGLSRLATPTLVRGDDLLRLFHRLGQSFRRVRRLRRVAEVDLHLVGIFPIPLATMVVGTLQKLVDRELLLLNFLVQLGDRLGLLHRRVAQLADLLILLDDGLILLHDLLTLLGDDRPACGKVVGKELRVVHVSQHSESFQKRKSTLERISQKTKKGFSRSVVREKPLASNDKLLGDTDVLQPARA